METNDINAEASVTRYTLGADIERINTRYAYYMDFLSKARQNVTNMKVKADRAYSKALLTVFAEKDPKGKYGLDKITVDSAKSLAETDTAYMEALDLQTKAESEVIEFETAVRKFWMAKETANSLADLWKANYFGDRSYGAPPQIENGVLGGMGNAQN
jgi:hypothetical protein